MVGSDDVQRTVKLDIKIWNTAVVKDFESVQFVIRSGQTVQYKQEGIVLQ